MVEYLIWKHLMLIVFTWVTVAHWGEPHGFEWITY